MAPVPYRVRSRIVESADSATLCLEPLGQALQVPQPGEFMMLYAFGVGEAAISISGDPSVTDGSITHTIRAVGAVSRVPQSGEARANFHSGGQAAKAREKLSAMATMSRANLVMP